MEDYWEASVAVIIYITTSTTGSSIFSPSVAVIPNLAVPIIKFFATEAELAGSSKIRFLCGGESHLLIKFHLCFTSVRKFSQFLYHLDNAVITVIFIILVSAWIVGVLRNRMQPSLAGARASRRPSSLFN